MTARPFQTALLLLVAAAAVGCGRSGPERFAVSGRVTLDGAPLPDGEIVFRPDAGTAGPTASGPIVDGRYEIAAERGPVAGTYAVSITAERPTGRKVRADILGDASAEQYEQYLPSQYNERTTLEATIEDDRDDVDFELTSSG